MTGETPPGAAQTAPLLIYLNADVAMERPYRATLPPGVDTLAELCQYLTSHIPPRPGEDTTGRGYRFLYSVTGKPLWRVKECLDARAIVLSVGPGFLARRPASLTAGPTAAAAAAAVPTVVDDTPDRPAAQVVASSGSGTGREGSPSASPPIKRPAEDAYGMGDGRGAASTAAAFAAAAAAAAAQRRHSDGDGRTASATTAPGAAEAASSEPAGSVDAAWPPAPSMPRLSQVEDRDRLVSITMPPAMRGRLSSSTGASLPSSQQRPAPATSADVPRGMVFLAHETHPLPPRQTFAAAVAPPTAQGSGAASLLAAAQAPLASDAVSSSLQYLLLRKWSAYQRLHRMAPADLVAGEALSQAFHGLAPKSPAPLSTAAPPSCRVLVSGPPRSGVSTTAAFVLRHLLRTLHFQPQHALHKTLVLVMDFEVLFGAASAAGESAGLASSPSTAPPPRLLLDLAALYQLIVRCALDAVVAQRPALREAGPLLAQLWDLVIKPNVQPPVPPNFTTYSQAAAVVGIEVLARWTTLAAQMYHILQAACRTPEVLELRAAALDLIFYAIPAELAASLRFSGLLYALDGLGPLARCYADRVTRPAGDLGPLLQAVTADPRTHLLLAWPSTLPPQSLYLPGLTAHVSTIGLVSRAALNAMQFPQVLRSRGAEYPIEVFLGCPGYLAVLAALARPFRKTLSIPTTAYSTYYQQHYESGGVAAASASTSAATQGYALRLDTAAAAHVLAELFRLVQALPLP